MNNDDSHRGAESTERRIHFSHHSVPSVPRWPAFPSRRYAELAVTSNFTFLTGASHPEELVAQAVACQMRIGEIAVPTRYFEEASSVNFRRSCVYGLSTLKVVLRFLLHRMRLRRSRKLAGQKPTPQ